MEFPKFSQKIFKSIVKLLSAFYDISKRTWKGFMRSKIVDRPQKLEESLTAEELFDLQARSSVLSQQFCLILILSTVIATLGLMGDSPVTIIGAMLIAPMMKPIIALAYGLVIGKHKLVRQASFTLGVGIILSVLVPVGLEQMLTLKGETTQILSRTHPSLIDLGVAVAAGTAAALATVRKNVADSLPGVAIAVALVPPLCVVGIGLSLNAWDLSLGATLLFSVNLIAIIVCACLVFLLEGYGSWQQSGKAMVGLIFLLVGMYFPLATSLEELADDDRAQTIIESFIAEQFLINGQVHPGDLRQVSTQLFQDHIFVFVEIESPSNMITQSDGYQIQKLLTSEFRKPVNLKIQLALTEEFKIYSFTPEGKLPVYGVDDYIPRR